MSNFTIKDAVIVISQLYTVVTEQNKCIKELLKEIKSAKAHQLRIYTLEDRVQDLHVELEKKR